MSIIMSNTTTIHPPEPLSWKQADDDVHVATRAGEFAGFVESNGAAHLVHDSRGTELGSFDSLEDARDALEGAVRRRARPIRQSLRHRLSRVRS